ncbi:CPBP family intramembrane glutamic endopeptidase [Reichenbachiella versicolor]|uniref:CPBP family intramembrane glutamic endopeptidase n=1 Tax=Reichenbachiella versicolor TaxID=1821036 RepID=UPI000D6DDF72|nr:CPBP family intramembrane glutamic endopeptidase [Reichenbachiella versicolor]
MAQKQFWNQLILFSICLLLILSIREILSYQLIAHRIESYQIHTALNIVANVILILVSIFFINKNELGKVAGLKGTKLKKWFLLIFPLAYLVLLNVLFSDSTETNYQWLDMVLFVIYCLSIGFAEELSIRGFLQSHLISRLGNTKKGVVLSVFISALFFGVIHLLNFDAGITGELLQVSYATFIGVMFGAVLVITKRLYPLMIIHSIIDFVGELELVGVPIIEKIKEPVSIEDALIVALLVSPCLFYGVFLMIRHRLIEEEK